MKKQVWISATVILMVATALIFGRTFALYGNTQASNEFVGTAPDGSQSETLPTPVPPEPTPPPDGSQSETFPMPPVKGETTHPIEDDPIDCGLLPPHNGHHDGDDYEPPLGAFDPEEHPKTADASDLKPLLAGLVIVTILLKLTIFGGKGKGG